MTEAEHILWEHIRKRKVEGYKFRRQYSIKGFVIDFYSPEARLAIEVDGGYHLHRHQNDYDKARQRLIESLKINFIRFKNADILTDIDQTISKIKDEINNPLYFSHLVRGRCHEVTVGVNKYNGEDVPTPSRDRRGNPA